jgi:hypothetical protein
MPRPNNIPEDRLIAAFMKLMAQAGMPVERVEVATRRRGRTPRIFRLADGRTMRVRTNNKPVTINLAESGRADAVLPFEPQDFLGAVLPGEAPNTAVAYLIPSARAAIDIKRDHAAWLEDPSHARDNRVRTTTFTGDPREPGFGYGDKWREFCLGSISLDTPMNPDGPIVALSRLQRAHRELLEAAAEEFSVPIDRLNVRLGVVGSSSEMILPLL